MLIIAKMDLGASAAEFGGLAVFYVGLAILLALQIAARPFRHTPFNLDLVVCANSIRET